jgi:[ribosomal protein S5]-alanine N-acetyltransferase
VRWRGNELSGKSIELIPIVPGVVRSADVLVREELQQMLTSVVLQSEMLLARSPREAPFGAYLACDAESRELVGTCAFKDPPTSRGAVEIAYFTFPPCEGKGYASAMARALVDIAFAQNQIRRVIAHTRPENNASTRILTKLGFKRTRQVNDPEDGLVWRWEKRRE